MKRVLISVLGTPLIELVWGEDPKPDPPAPSMHANGQGEFAFGLGRYQQELVEGGHSS